MVRRLIIMCLLLLPAVAQGQDKATDPADQSKTTLEGLLAEFKKSPGLEASFREEKHLALLAAPLVNEGTLHFAKGQAARHVTKPTRQTVLVTKDAIRMGDGKHTESLSLKGNPVLRQFLDSFMKVFAGDKAGLEESYETTFRAEKEAWTLALVPRNKSMKKAIRKIALVGKGLALSSLTIEEVGGDKTVTTFKDVNPNRTYSEKELETLFRLPKGKP